MKPRVDLLTIVGLGMLMMPILTMWHEIGGHAAFCVAQGGNVSTIGAFYVQCEDLSGTADIIVSCAGVLVNILLAAAAFGGWQRTTSDLGRLGLWLVWVSEAFVAAGYLIFSGATGFGDLAPGAGGGLGPVPHPMLWRAGEFALGLLLYFLVVRAAVRTLAEMIGNGLETRAARRTIAHGYYVTAGLSAVLTGALNPVGILIVIMSAAASSFGGLAGFISVGFATRHQGQARGFVVRRNWPLIVAGGVVLVAFARSSDPRWNFDPGATEHVGLKRADKGSRQCPPGHAMLGG